MPRAYLTLEERERAKKEKAEQKENFMLRSILKEKIFRKIGYEYISQKTGFSEPTIGKIVNHPEKATVEQLRAVCDAVGVPLMITAEIA